MRAGRTVTITKQGDNIVLKLIYEASTLILTRSRGSFALKTWTRKIAKRRGLRKAREALAGAAGRYHARDAA